MGLKYLNPFMKEIWFVVKIRPIMGLKLKRRLGIAKTLKLKSDL